MAGHKNIQDIYTLTPMQEGMLFHALRDKSSSAYFEQITFQISGKLDVSLVERSLNDLFRRHDILRTSFLFNEVDRPLQVVLRERKIDFYFEDLRCMQSDAGKELLIREFADRDRVRSFHITKEPLMRVSVFQLHESEFKFIWSHHHIIMDGWCIGILMNEYFHIYNSHLHNRSWQLPRVTAYSTYIKWLEAQDKTRAKAYWRQYLQGYEHLNGIPQKHFSGPPQPVNKRSYRFSVDKKRTGDLQVLAAKHHATLNHVIQSLWGTLLAKYNGRRDVVFGTVVSGRPSEIEGIESMIGLFINTIPVRIHFDHETTFSELLRKVKGEAIESEPHHYFPLAEIQGQHTLRHNLLNHYLAFENFPLHENIEKTSAVGDETENELSISCTSVFEQSNYGLNVTIAPGSQLAITVHYDAEVYDNDFVAGIEQHYERLIDQVLEDEEVVLDDLFLLAPEDAGLQHHPWNESLPSQKCLHEIFSEQASLWPDRIAIVFGDHALSYRTLNERATKVANYLRAEFDLRPDTLIGIMTGRTEWMIIGIMGILKSCAAYVPLDPDYPESRLHYIIDDASINVILSDRQAGTASGCVINLKEKWVEIAGYSTEAAAALCQPSCISYVIYTSGSTGRPKGVPIEHRSVVRLLINDKDRFAFSALDSWTLFHSVSFDFSVWEIFGALLYGGKLVLVPREIVKDAAAFLKMLVADKITVLNQVPSMFNTIMAAASENKPDLCLRYIIFGGEALNPASLASWLSLYPQTKLINMYGITETTVHVTYKEVGAADVARGSSNIGEALPTVQVYLMNEQRQPMPRGTVGEIVVGGSGLGRGYLNQVELTAERFIRNPYNPGERLYCSGDLAVETPNGDLFYLGRKDSQVKVRGYRIELGEIESRILRYPTISQAVVSVHEDGLGDKNLVAFYIAKGDVVESALRQYLIDDLPSFMVPSAFVAMDRFPETPSGKIDHKALLLFKDLKAGKQDALVAPASESEKVLVKIWSDILDKGDIGVTANFFTSGGDSIKAIRVVSAINRTFGVSVEVKDIFMYDHIRSLAAFIDGIGKTSGANAIEVGRHELNQLKDAIVHDPVASKALPPSWEDIYPMSDIQEGMIFYNILRPDAGAYIDHFFYQIVDASFDHGIFKTAFRLLVERHPVLRTSFHLSEFGQPMQVVHKSDREVGNISYEDIAQLGQEQQKEHVTNAIMALRKSVSEIEAPGLWRMSLFRLKREEYGILWVFHHAILDGWSNASLITELSNVYYNLKAGKPHLNEPLKAQYKDFIADQRRSKERPELKQFWKRTLENFERLRLPLFKKIQGYGPSDRTHQFSFTLGRELTHSMQWFSEQKKLNAKSILLAAFVWLLKQTTGQRDITIGLVTNNRPEAEDGDKVMGCFLNTIPFRMALPEIPSGYALVSSVHTSMNSLKAYDKLPLVEISNLLEAGSFGHNPIFDVIFNYTDFHVAKDTHKNTITTQALIPSYESTNTYFDFTVTQTGHDALVKIHFADALYKEQELVRIAGYYKRILKQIVRSWDSLLVGDDLLDDEERARISTYSSRTLHAPAPPNGSIPDVFRAQVRKNPDSIAVAHGSEHLSYRELDHRSDMLASYLLQKFGGRPHPLIGLMVTRSPYLIVSIMGILKTGGAYLPLDESIPDERVRYILEDANIAMVITDHDRLRNFPVDLSVVRLKNEWNLISSASTHNLAVHNTPGALAYVMYTSGSTGFPKGVMITHHNVVRMVRNAECPRFSAMDKVLQLSNFAFDGSVFDIFGALLNGSSLHLIDKHVIYSTEALVECIRTEKINAMLFTTAMFNKVIEHCPEIVAHFDRIYFGGEKCSVSHVRKALPYRRQVDSIVHLYGPTEATTFSSFFEISYVDEVSETIPIGGPLSDTELFILDHSMSLTPLNVPGELYIGGDGLALGYLNNPTLTAERFVGHPTKQGGRLYRTGDICRWLESGMIEFVGRNDGQIKLRGYRIEPSEIETTMLQHPGIQQAVVLLKEDPFGDKMLVGYYTSRSGLLESTVRSYLGEKLPSYAVPSHLIRMEFFDLNKNGKVDREKLPDPGESTEKSVTYVPPRNATEAILVKIWSEVLNKKGIGVTDNFFELGGHSLKATQVMSRIYRSLNVKVDLKALFTNFTIEKLARSLTASTGKAPVPVLPAKLQEYYPLSHTQVRLWIASQLSESQKAYNIPGLNEFSGTLDKDALQRSFDLLIARHESLRTVFPIADGQPRQKILSPEAINFRISFSDLSKAADKEQAWIDMAIHEFREGFDLAKGPLIRVLLIGLEADRHICCFTMHHIISDGWSMQILINEVLLYYNALTENREITLPPLSLQFKDYAVWQNSQIGDESFQAYKRFWLDQFDGELPILQLPGDFKRPEKFTFKGEATSFVIDRDVTAGIQKLSMSNEATVFMVLLSALNIMLNKYAGQDEMIIGTPVAGRIDDDLENVIGNFLNVLPLRLRTEEHFSYKELLDHVKNVSLGAFEHQLYPFDILIDDLQIKRHPGRSLLFDVVIVVQNIDLAGESPAGFNGIHVTPMEIKERVVKSDLKFQFKESGETIICEIEYYTDLFKASTIELFKDNLLHILRLVTANEDVLLRDISLLLTQEEVNFMDDVKRYLEM